MAEIMNTPLPVSEPQGETTVNGQDQKQRAQERLTKAMEAVKEDSEKAMLAPITDHLKKRIREDAGFADDVLQEHKTLNRMMKYIRDKARKYATGNCVAVPDATVYEWAEDYIRLDDKALAEKEKKEEEARKAAKAEQEKKKAAQKAEKSDRPTDKNVRQKTENAQKKAENDQPKKKAPRNQVEGQMSLFDMLGA